jgi:hypothetical protein
MNRPAYNSIAGQDRPNPSRPAVAARPTTGIQPSCNPPIRIPLQSIETGLKNHYYFLENKRSSGGIRVNPSRKKFLEFTEPTVHCSFVDLGCSNSAKSLPLLCLDLITHRCLIALQLGWRSYE